jgi:hypothetical protein
MSGLARIRLEHVNGDKGQEFVTDKNGVYLIRNSFKNKEPN